MRANEEWKQQFLDAIYDSTRKQMLLEAVDVANKRIPIDEPHEMEATEETKKALRKSNAQYYLGVGWTKEQLIAERGFAEEDFK